MMMKKKKPTVIIGTIVIALLVLAATMTTTTTAVYAQESILLFEPNENTEMLITEAIDTLQSIANETDSFEQMVISDNGDLDIFFDSDTIGDPEDPCCDVSLWTYHNYTPANGYEFRGEQIIAPNGTQLLSGN
jgi:hypothetical protein